MIVSLVVHSDSSRQQVGVTTEVPWTVPPPINALWSCCRLEALYANVEAVYWSGIDGNADIYVLMQGTQSHVHHLSNQHGFAPW